MKTLLPSHTVLAFLLLVIQTYLLVQVTLLILRSMKLLKRPYSGMEYAESLLAGMILASVLFISSADGPGIFQAVKFYGNRNALISEPSLLFFARSFLVVIFFSIVSTFLNYLNARFLFQGYLQAPGFPVSILLSAIAVGLAIISWFSCREIVDNMTPSIIALY